MSLKNSVLFMLILHVTTTGFCNTASIDSSNPSVSANCTGILIDYYYLNPLRPSAAYSSLTDQYGNFFIAGSATDSNNSLHWIVRKSANNGQKWITVDDYQYQSGSSSSDDIEPVLGKDIYGNLYVAGSSFDSEGNVHWIVRKSTDSGSTWNTVDDFRTTGIVSIATSFTSDANGNIYVAGYGSTSHSGYHWFVKKSNNAGATWSVIDNFQLPDKGDAGAASLTSDNNGNIYCTGIASNQWVVRRSNDNGNTWTTVDNFQGAGDLSAPRTIIADATNTLYAAGTSFNPYPNGNVWVVRKSVDSGITWGSVDNYQPSSAQIADPQGMATDTNGALYTVGKIQDATGFHWVTRRSTDQGATWSTIDNFQMRGKPMAEGKTIWTDASGNIYTAGMASSRWIVRKVSCQ